MNKKLMLFALLNIVIYFTGITFYGFYAAIPLMVFFSFIIFFMNIKKYGFNISLTFIVLYLIIFDSDFFTFTNFKIRLWYFILIFLLVTKFYYLLFKKKLRLKKENFLYYMTLLYFIVFSIYYLITDKYIGKLYILKYWIFYIGLIYVLYNTIKKLKREQLICFLDFLISLAIIVTIFGIIQYYFNITRGIHNIYNIPLYNAEIRPPAFFSETTWYSEYLVIGTLLVFLRMNLTQSYKMMVFIPFFLIGIIISVTRNSYLAIFVVIMIVMILNVLSLKINIKIFKSIYFRLTIFVIFIVYEVFYNYINRSIISIYNRFTNLNGPGSGRLEAFKIGVKLILEKPVFGHGFYWDPSFSTSEGNALGAKSFNVLIMVAYIFGFVGLFFLFLLLFLFLFNALKKYISKNSLLAKYSILFMIAFWVMSSFAPMHQFPMGMYLISLSLLFANNDNWINYEKNYHITTKY